GVKKITGTDIGRFKGFEVMGRGVSGRMTRLKVIGTQAAVEIAPELRIRQALGSLKSSTFVWDRGDGSVTFIGAGFGHGVGMCQNGAIGMADAGRTYQQILAHYYSGSEVVKIY
ncbi:MAG TPA: stage II sporulation protein SpoIID, partial [Myxococcota bacterium]|nr:stage II sporulation protein SpoIID [Myxococcota bacterium]